MRQKFKNKKCVVICGGEGTRLSPITRDLPKSLVPIKGKPILYYIIEYWRFLTDDFIFVLNYKREDIENFVRSLSINAEFIAEDDEPKGIANALLQAENFVKDKFIMVLGDCICTGAFNFPEEMEQGVGVWETSNLDDIRQSYSVEMDKGRIIRVVEKPKILPNNYCGLGFYFFDQKIFEAIRQTKPSVSKKRVELTDSIQTMIDDGETISPVLLKGKYLNLTYPKDIKKAEKIL